KENYQSVARKINDVMWTRGVGILSPTLKTFHDKCVRSGYKLYNEGTDILFRNNKNEVVARISSNVPSIRIPDHHGSWAQQSASQNALSALAKTSNGDPLYRIGSLNVSAGPEARYWSLENPLDFADIEVFSKRYGIPKDNLTSGNLFVEVGRVKENIPA